MTCLPATGEPSDAQFVASVSSISVAMLMPSPLAVAPLALDARLAACCRAGAHLAGPQVSVVRTWPKPGARATKS